MNRFGAFAIHLGISLVIFLIIGYLILFHWYPDFFFASDGGWQGIRIVAFVDLVLGPTLTLVVFNKTKPRKELRRDLSIIGLVQAVCLTGGVWVVYSERPVAMVFSDGSFQSMTMDDYHEVGVQPPRSEDCALCWYSVRLPEDPSAQSRIRRELLESKRPLKTLVSHYQPFEVSHIDVDRDGISPEQADLVDPNTFKQFFAEHGGSNADYLFLPFGTRYQPALLALNKAEEVFIFLPIVFAEKKSAD